MALSGPDEVCVMRKRVPVIPISLRRGIMAATDDLCDDRGKHR